MMLPLPGPGDRGRVWRAWLARVTVPVDHRELPPEPWPEHPAITQWMAALEADDGADLAALLLDDRYLDELMAELAAAGPTDAEFAASMADDGHLDRFTTRPGGG